MFKSISVVQVMLTMERADNKLKETFEKFKTDVTETRIFNLKKSKTFPVAYNCPLELKVCSINYERNSNRDNTN